MADGWTSKLILAFVTLLVGIVLIGQVATEGNIRTNLATTTEQIDLDASVNATDVINDTYTITVLGDTNADCELTSYTFENTTGTDFTETTDYVLTTSNGQFYLENTTETVENLQGDELINVTYTYCPKGYMTQDWGRTAIDLTPGFFAIALLLASIALFYSVWRDFKGM